MMQATRSPNIVLQYERLSRHWTQQYVAETIGTTKINISRWERGFTRPGPYFRLKLCTLFAKSEQELGMMPGVKCPPLSQLDTAFEYIAASVQQQCKALILQEPVPEKLLFTLSRYLPENNTSLAKNGEVPPLQVYIVFGSDGQ